MSGEVIITGISGTTLSTYEESFIKNERIGGVILFAKNFVSPQQLGALVNEIQFLRDNVPLFIAVDQEGGRVQRFKNEFTIIPPMLNIAEKSSPKLCFEIHNIISEELIACGVNLNFSPVCDILTKEANKAIGDRAFGRDAESVAKLVSAAIRGCQVKGILTCAKHFPGHGDTLIDSHEELPVINLDLQTILDRELVPFRRAVKSKVDFVMMSHLLFPAIDPDYPCSLSEKVYNFLRKELKFRKLIITDDMEMGAIIKKYSVEESSVRAINAGADILIYRSMENAQKALYAIKESLHKGTISEKIFNEKIKRIIQCKEKSLSNYSPLNISDIKSQMRVNEHQAFLASLA